jgi:hypothetical protein
VTAVLEAGALRYITVGGREVVRGVYAAVRDRDWGTVPPRFTRYEVDDDGRSFAVRFTAEHTDGNVDFAWEGRISGTEDGVISFAFDGEARRPFLRNRIGFCVLHPMALAGAPVSIETPAGWVDGAFPGRISPHQPFFDIVAIRHSPDGAPDARATVEIRFTGDLFETEDQRNWTDASYKTYCTPLRLPMPVEVRPGATIRQTVTLAVRGSTAEPAAGASKAEPEIRVGAEPLGPLPPLGLGMASHGESFADTAGSPDRRLSLAWLRALNLDHLRLDLDLTASGWEDRLARGIAEARALETAGLELEVVAGDDGEGLERLIPLLVDGPPVARLLVFPKTGVVSTEPPLARARKLATKAGLDIPIGGGSRAYFTELNRAELPLHLMDVVSYTINPQVHAFDNASLVETLAAQPVTVANAKTIAGGRPVAVGPVTLRPRFNAVASGPEPELGPDELPPTVDPRQLSLFAAGWTVGSIRRLAEAGPASLTYYETTGWRGVMERHGKLTRRTRFPSQPGLLFPLCHVLCDIGQVSGAKLLPVQVGDPLAVEALALSNPSGVRILVASFLDERRTVRLSLPVSGSVVVRYLDETTADQAMTDGVAFSDAPATPGEASDGEVELDLRPFAVARLDGPPPG